METLEINTQLYLQIGLVYVIIMLLGTLIAHIWDYRHHQKKKQVHQQLSQLHQIPTKTANL